MEKSRLQPNAGVIVGGQRIEDGLSSGKYNARNVKNYITMNDEAFSGKNIFNMNRDNASQSH